MSKSSWKLPYISFILFKKKFLEQNKTLNLRKKNSLLPYIFLKKNIKLTIYNGIWYLSLVSNINMKGYKLGEFIFTKKIDTQTHLKKKVQKKPKGKK